MLLVNTIFKKMYVNVYFCVIYFSEPLLKEPFPYLTKCMDKDECSSVTTNQCSALPSLRTICPLTCDVEQCRGMKCEDTPECPDGLVPSLCGSLSNEDKYKCNQTCGLCHIQGEFDN